MSGFQLIEGAGTEGGSVIADRELYADAALTRLLEAGDPEASVMLAAFAGRVIPRELAEPLGLVVVDGCVRQRGAAHEKPVAPAESAKEAKQPAKDKQRVSGKNK